MLLFSVFAPRHCFAEGPLVVFCCEDGRLTQGAVAGAVNTLISILHTPRLRSQTTSSPQTRSCTDTRHVFSLHNSLHPFRHIRLTRSLPPIQDFGAWNITYASVSCKEWKGWGNEAAKGSVPNMGGCCPANPTVRIMYFEFPGGWDSNVYLREVKKIPAHHTPMQTA